MALGLNNQADRPLGRVRPITNRTKSKINSNPRERGTQRGRYDKRTSERRAHADRLLSPVRDESRIAQYVSAGVRSKNDPQVPLGTTDHSPMSVVPDGIHERNVFRGPSTEVLGYFRVSLSGQIQSRSVGSYEPAIASSDSQRANAVASSLSRAAKRVVAAVMSDFGC